jgi:hypothetical protein
MLPPSSGLKSKTSEKLGMKQADNSAFCLLHASFLFILLLNSEDGIKAHIYVMSGIRTYDPSIRAGEDSSCFIPRGHYDRRKVYQ